MAARRVMAASPSAVDTAGPGQTTSPDQTGEDGLIRRGYRAYFGTGYYEKRYPRPNRLTVARIDTLLGHTGKPRQVLDFGCGSGRYILALLARPELRFTAFDICEPALQRLRQHLDDRDAGERVTVIADNRQRLRAWMERVGGADLVLVLFGVLAHVAGRRERIALLRLLAGALRPDGRLLLSVPNRRRRFPALQRRRRARREDIVYTRSYHHEEITLYYHLYEVEELAAELREAGLEVLEVRAESLFPESAVTRFRALRWLDGLLTPMLPPRLGYGILVVAHRAGGT